MNITFQLFGIDIIPKYNIFGIWFCSLNFWDDSGLRCLFSIYFDGSEKTINALYIELLFFKIAFM